MTPRLSVSSVQQVTLAWFAMVMGLCGLSLAWHRATPWWGPWALDVSRVWGGLAALTLCLLVLALLIKAWRYPGAWRDDLAHPVRHVFVAAVPASFVLLSTVMVTLQGTSPLAEAFWMGGSATLFAATVWVAQHWLRPGLSVAAFWSGMTPAMFIPVVGNVLPGLAGVALGHAQWAGMQYALGAVLWPVSLTLVWVRIGMVGLWPKPMLPATFVTIAPPAVLGLSGAQLGAPDGLVQMAWGLALFFYTLVHGGGTALPGPAIHHGFLGPVFSTGRIRQLVAVLGAPCAGGMGIGLVACRHRRHSGVAVADHRRCGPGPTAAA